MPQGSLPSSAHLRHLPPKLADFGGEGPRGQAPLEGRHRCLKPCGVTGGREPPGSQGLAPHLLSAVAPAGGGASQPGAGPAAAAL